MNQKGNSLLLILIVTLITLSILTYCIHLYQKKTFSETNHTPPLNEKSEEKVVQKKLSYIDKSPNERYLYDFEQLLNSFEKIKLEKYSMKFGIPQQMKFVIVNKDDINERTLSQYALHMESSDSSGTEIFDGMLIKINIYSKNQENISHTYEQDLLNPEQIKLYQDQKIKYTEKTIIGNNTYTIINHCCYGGLSKTFYLTNNAYIYEFETFSTGPDKENFNKIINKILEQVDISI